MNYNYIILHNRVYEDLRSQYQKICGSYGDFQPWDAYLHDVLFFDGSCRLMDTRRNDGRYTMVGKGCTLSVKEDDFCKNCLFGCDISFREQADRYHNMLRRTIALPGAWLPVSTDEAKQNRLTGKEPLSDVLGTLRASSRELRDFQDQWQAWDLYNQKLREKEERKEDASHLPVDRVTVEHDLITIHTAGWMEEYAPEKEVCAQFEQGWQESFVRLGQIESVNSWECTMDVRCADRGLLSDFMKGTYGAIQAVRMIDFGAKARIRRQRQALEKLFREETANPNLKDILTGNFQFPCFTELDEAAASVRGLFGSNVQQQKAYIGAISAEDIFLIQGPPGTGKTTIITAIVKYAVARNAHILVSSETNIAVDNVLERVSGVEQVIPVRLGREERISGSCRPYTLSNLSDSILQETQRKQAALDMQKVSIDTMVAGV